jgi:hypothetical protein
MKLTIEIPDDDFVNPEMTPQEQVEHLFKMHHIRATVSPVEPSYTEVADWLGNDCVTTKLILDHYKQEGSTGEKENQRQGDDN